MIGRSFYRLRRLCRASLRRRHIQQSCLSREIAKMAVSLLAVLGSRRKSTLAYLVGVSNRYGGSAGRYTRSCRKLAGPLHLRHTCRVATLCLRPHPLGGTMRPLDLGLPPRLPEERIGHGRPRSTVPANSRGFVHTGGQHSRRHDSTKARATRSDRADLPPGVLLRHGSRLCDEGVHHHRARTRAWVPGPDLTRQRVGCDDQRLCEP